MVKDQSQLKELEKQLLDLQEEIKKPQEHPTEVYTRIVGYYRSVANWNKGKRDEFNHRKTFVPTQEQTSGNFVKAEAKASVRAEMNESLDSVEKGPVAQFLFFWRDQCPQCPAVKSLLPMLPFKGESIDTDTEKGTEMAMKWDIYATPTMILLDKDGQEIHRLFNAPSVKELIA